MLLESMLLRFGCFLSNVVLNGSFYLFPAVYLCFALVKPFRCNVKQCMVDKPYLKAKQCQLWLGTYATLQSDQDPGQGLAFVYALMHKNLLFFRLAG